MGAFFSLSLVGKLDKKCARGEAMGDGGQVFNLENQRSNHSNGLFGHRVARGSGAPEGSLRTD
jgi:hypothetical protein